MAETTTTKRIVAWRPHTFDSNYLIAGFSKAHGQCHEARRRLCRRRRRRRRCLLAMTKTVYRKLCRAIDSLKPRRTLAIDHIVTRHGVHTLFYLRMKSESRRYFDSGERNNFFFFYLGPSNEYLGASVFLLVSPHCIKKKTPLYLLSFTSILTAPHLIHKYHPLVTPVSHSPYLLLRAPLTQPSSTILEDA